MWILFAILMLFLFSFAYAAVSGAPWVPTWKKDIDRIEAILQLQEGERFYELGCGDGRVSAALAKRSGAKVTGVELSLLQWMAAIMRKALTRSPAGFAFANVFTKDFSDADALYLFLMPETYEKIAPKLEQELKPGARVVTYVWPMPSWEPERVDVVEGSPSLFLYRR